MTKEKIELLKEFAAKTENDEALKAKINKAAEAKDVNKLVEIAAEEGFTFEAADFKAPEGDEKLDNEELGAVAGGEGSACTGFWGVPDYAQNLIKSLKGGGSWAAQDFFK